MSGDPAAAAQWRPMAEDDLPAVLAVAERVHPDFPEDEAVFAERLALYPAGCHVFATEAGIGGYLIFHPWHGEAPPALNTCLGALPRPASAYYLHDLAILPGLRKAGAGGAALSMLLAHAARMGLGTVRLVAVGGSAPFWRRHGFLPVGAPELAGKLASYGADAQLMALPLERR